MSRADKIEAYRIFVTGIETANKTWQEVTSMSIKQIRNFIGEEAAGLTHSFLVNMKNQHIKTMKRAEVQSAAEWTISRITMKFPDAGVRISGERSFQIFLDDVPEDIE